MADACVCVVFALHLGSSACLGLLLSTCHVSAQIAKCKQQNDGSD